MQALGLPALAEQVESLLQIHSELLELGLGQGRQAVLQARRHLAVRSTVIGARAARACVLGRALTTGSMMSRSQLHTWTRCPWRASMTM